MEVRFIEAYPNENSIEKELSFSFGLKIESYNITPINVFGKVSTSDGKKIGNLVFTGENIFTRSILMNGVSDRIKNSDELSIRLSCVFSDAAFNHIEKLRDKLDKEDITFKISLTVMVLKNNLQVSGIRTADPSTATFKKIENGNRLGLYYEYGKGQYYNSQKDMYIVSSEQNEVIAELQCNHRFDNITATIGYSKWLKEYIPYFSGQKVFVYEIPLSPYKYIPKKIHAKFLKANIAIEEMKKQMLVGNWKSAVGEGRPVYELFRNLDDFNNLLVNSGYFQAAADDIKKSLSGFFDFIAKTMHPLEQKTKKNPTPELNPDIEINKEDAIFIYVNCVSLLNLISEKSKRLGV